MAFEIDNLVNEINKFKSNVTNSSDLISKLEATINVVKKSAEDSTLSIDDQVKNTKAVIESLKEETKSSVLGAIGSIEEIRENFSEKSAEIISNCENLIKSAENTIKQSLESVKNLETELENMQAKVKKEGKLLKVLLIIIAAVSVITLIVSIISLAL